MLSKHLKKVPEDRKAIAPYNFVELPNKVVEVAEDSLPNHDSYDPKRHTGRIECTLTTSSPLYIRGGWTPEDFTEFSETPFKDLPEAQKRQRANFCHNPATQRPTIPGSSLRGMLRILVEIISYSKIDKYKVSGHQRLFFRAVATTEKEDSLAKEYKKYVKPENIKAGYLKRSGDKWLIHPARIIDGLSFAWIKEKDLSSADFPTLIKLNDSGYIPQYISVSFKTIKKNKNRRYFAEDVSLPETYPMNAGKLVTSGNMKQNDDPSVETNRSNHCIVFAPSPSPTRYEIDPDSIKYYLNALTDFQQQEPFDGNLGMLADARPVFYCQPQQGNIVTLFGQSPNFRVPYSPQGDGKAATVLDFIPKNLQNSSVIDIADSIFGFIKDKKPGEKQAKARFGRIFVSDGICEKTASDDIWMTNRTLTPKILASPKPTTFQHYLVQTSSAKKDLKHYASQPEQETIIRGHKLYWHKGASPSIQHENPDGAADTQKTEIKPIKPGVTFNFTICFENLSDVELGALLWVLDVAKDEKYRLSLGMGKPLGMGAVKIEFKLYFSNRKQRYSSLFNGFNWETGEKFEADPDYPKLFENYVLEKIQQTGKFRDIERIQMLLAMLTWQGSPSADKTRYMEIERQQQPLDGDPNEYKTRRVLPTPLQVIENRRRDRPTPRPSTHTQNQESPRQTTSPPTKPSQPQAEYHESGQANKFSVGQIVEAKVLDIVTKVIDSKKTKTTITYEVNGSKVGKPEEVYKKSVSFAIGDIVRLKITELKDGNIKKYERLEELA